MNLGINPWIAGIVAAISLSLLQPAPAQAGPIGCAMAISGCIKGSLNVEKAIKESRRFCEALQDCKIVCRGTKKVVQKDNKTSKKACLSGCKSKNGKSKRSCKKSCRKTQRSANNTTTGIKKGCIKQCKAEYKTPLCRDARKNMVKTMTRESLKCVPKIAANCSPAPLP